MVFGADAAFAKPEIYQALEERKVKYVIRLPANNNLERKVAQLLKRPVGRPSYKPVVRYRTFFYQAASWERPRRVVAKVEFHFGELFPAGRVYRDQLPDFKPGGGALLQQTWHGGTMDQVALSHSRTSLAWNRWQSVFRHLATEIGLSRTILFASSTPRG